LLVRILVLAAHEGMNHDPSNHTLETSSVALSKRLVNLPIHPFIFRAWDDSFLLIFKELCLVALSIDVNRDSQITNLFPKCVQKLRSGS
jgi:hypothetical protein